METEIQTEIVPITTEASAITITSAGEMTVAVELLSRLNSFNDRITTEKERITKPLNEALKAERSRWKPAETMLESAISAIRAKMSAYQTKMLREAEAEKARIASRVKEGKGNLTLETAVAKIAEVETPEAKVVTDSGSLKFRSVPTLKVIDLTKIPREYFDLNEKKVLDALKASKIVPGATIEIIQQPINYRG